MTDFNLLDQGLGSLEHIAGTPSTGSVLDVGLKCTHSCRFCYYSYLDKSDDQFSGMRRASFRTAAECKTILELLKQNGFTHFDVTGGEPCLHPQIVELMRFAHEDLSLKGRIITLGQFLMKKLPSCTHGKILIEELLDAGLTNFLFSMHAVEENLFKRTTGESWERLKSALEYLDSKNFYYTSNTTVFEWNLEHLPDIANEILKHKIYMHNFIIMNAYYEWNQEGRAFGIQARYSDIFPHLKRAVDLLEKNNVAVNIRYAPLCSFPGLERNIVGGVGVRYDPYEWMNKAGHAGGSPAFCAERLALHHSGVDEDWIYSETLASGEEAIAKRGSVKHFPKACSQCKARSGCDGVDPKYLSLYADKEFKPYRDRFRAGPVIEERRNYRPAFQLKWEQNTNMGAVIKNAFSETAVSPALPSVAVVYLGEKPSGLAAQNISPDAVFSANEVTDLENLKKYSGIIILQKSVEHVLPFTIERFKESLRDNPHTHLILSDSYKEDSNGAISHVPVPGLSLTVLAMDWPLSAAYLIPTRKLEHGFYRQIVKGRINIASVARRHYRKDREMTVLGIPSVRVSAQWGNSMRNNLSFKNDWRDVTAPKNWGRASSLAPLIFKKVILNQRKGLGG